MGEPIRSRLLDYIEPDSVEGEPAAPSESPAQSSPSGADSQPEPRRSRILDYAEATPAQPGTANPTHAAQAPAGPSLRPAPKPGVPAYETPVFVPAHPRSVVATDAHGRPTRVPFIVYELFEHPTHGRAAFAFTTLDGLVAALGDAQPWIAASIGPLAEGMSEHGAIVCLDPRLAPGQHNWQPADLAAYAQEVR